MEEKQIEEMTKDLKENLRLCAGIKLLDHQVETIAYELSKKYQPKLSKDSVVLTKDNAEELANLIVTSPQMQSVMSDLIKAWQKETAKKIIKWFKENSVCIPSDEYINEFAKQFGIEIKE